MRHEAGARAEQGEVAAALLHLLELVVGDGVAQLIVADLEIAGLWHQRAILDARDLPVAPILQRLGCGGVVAMDVDDHCVSPLLAAGSKFPPARFLLLFEHDLFPKTGFHFSGSCSSATTTTHLRAPAA